MQTGGVSRYCRVGVVAVVLVSLHLSGFELALCDWDWSKSRLAPRQQCKSAYERFSLSQLEIATLYKNVSDNSGTPKIQNWLRVLFFNLFDCKSLGDSCLSRKVLQPANPFFQKTAAKCHTSFISPKSSTSASYTSVVSPISTSSTLHTWHTSSIHVLKQDLGKPICSCSWCGHLQERASNRSHASSAPLDLFFYCQILFRLCS